MQKLNQPVPPEILKRNLDSVRTRIAQAAAKSGRSPELIRLVAITKYVNLSAIQGLHQLGVTDFGESRIQDAEKKIAAFATSSSPPVWHLVGHLQTNKADKASRLFQFIHSVDSPRVAEALNKEQTRNLQRTVAGGQEPRAKSQELQCLLEINTAGEESKFGLPPQEGAIRDLLKACTQLPALRIVGLMTMAPYSDNPEATSRPVFRRLRALLEDANSSGVYPTPLTELSMGMTQDFEIAIEEGATMVRVGSALFE
ncbi:MAG TPA: YggS family pyridoxal phosphate-dependent enzyme [Planctomycetota bacterium]|jgi:hypothetical protein